MPATFAGSSHQIDGLSKVGDWWQRLVVLVREQMRAGRLFNERLRFLVRAVRGIGFQLAVGLIPEIVLASFGFAGSFPKLVRVL